MVADGNGAAGTTADDGWLQRAAPGIAWGLAALFVVLFGLILWMDSRVYAIHLPELGSWAWVGLHGVWLGPFVVFAVVGAVIASRRPRHAIGWLMLGAAVASGTGEAARWYAAMAIGTAPGDPPTLAEWLSIPSAPLTFTGLVLGLVLIPLLFPTGQLPSRRWRPVPWAAGLFLGVSLLTRTLSPRLTHVLNTHGNRIELYDVANPASPAWGPDLVGAAPPAAELLLPLLVVLAGAAVVVRFRRSEGVQRQQMKWFVYAAALVALAAAAQVITAMISPGMDPISATLLVLGLSAYPAAVGVAVLRYRLFEIDRIISRTVSYGLVVAVLGGVYVAGVVGLGAAVTAVTGQQESDLVVAVSTLAVAGLFGPVRARVQSVVDRRFNRTGYEARLAVEAFTREVRDEVNLEQIRRRVAETAAVATQPAHVSLWLPRSEGQRP